MVGSFNEYWANMVHTNNDAIQSLLSTATEIGHTLQTALNAKDPAIAGYAAGQLGGQAIIAYAVPKGMRVAGNAIKRVGPAIFKNAKGLRFLGGETIAAVKPSNALQEVLKNAVPTPGKPNQLEAILNDGSKVIFRRDIGEHAHNLYPKYPLGTKTDHFNIEIQKPNTQGGFKTIENLHIVVDKQLNPVEVFSIKKGDIYNESDFQNRLKPSH